VRWIINLFLKTFNVKQTVLFYANFVWVGLFRRTWSFLKFLGRFLYKKFIDFLFFDLYRNRDYIRSFLRRFSKLSFYVLFVYTLLYLDAWGFIFNYIFVDSLDTFIVWDITTYRSTFNIFLSLLNIDNLFLFIYLVFFKVGVSYIHYHEFLESFIRLWGHWEYFLVEFKPNHHNYSFF